MMQYFLDYTVSIFIYTLSKYWFKPPYCIISSPCSVSMIMIQYALPTVGYFARKKAETH